MSKANSLGPLTPYNPPSIMGLQGYSVNREGQHEVIWQPQYDYQSYPMAGATQFTFFQTPVGQNGATLADTSMRSAGQFPSPQEFLITGIQVVFTPGGAFSAGNLAAAIAQENWNDVGDVMLGNAFLELFVGSKAYLDDGPLAKFGQTFGIVGNGDGRAATTVAATTINTQIDYARHSSKYYSITPVKIPKTQNFNVTLNFPAAIAIAANATIGVILDGFLYRLSQ